MIIVTNDATNEEGSPVKVRTLTESFPLQDKGFAKHVLLRSREGLVLMLGVDVGQTVPPHRHPGHDVQVLVVQGKGRFSLQGREQEGAAGAVLPFGGDVEFGVQNDGPGPLYMIVFLRPVQSV